MNGMFQYKVYRQKFIIMVITVILVTFLACIGTCLFQVNKWAIDQENIAIKTFERAEVNLAFVEQQVEKYIQRIYYDPMLIKDLLNVFVSVDQQDYLRRRTQTSLGNTALINSFPTDLQSFLFSRQNIIPAVSLYNGRWYNFLTIDPEGKVEVFFQVKDPTEIINPVMGETLLSSRILYNPTQLSQNMGVIQFWINNTWVFDGVTPGVSGLVAAVGEVSGHYIVHQEGKPKQDDWIDRAVAQTESRGDFLDRPFNRVHYICFSSSLFPYQFVSVVDDWTLIARNAPMLIFICSAITLTGIAALVILISSIRYDARFLGSILKMIEQVQCGDFETVRDISTHTLQEEALAEHTNHNEYGIIMLALSDMSKELGEYIRIEYQLKIKQQEAAMRALQHQINPHFLYNTLEAIRSHALISEDKMTADSIAILGSLYRDIVRNQDVLTLGEEMELLSKYLKIMDLRYPEHFCYQFEIEPEMLEIQTVKFWMQPLAENFFSHGFDPQSEYNLFIVSGTSASNGYLVQFIDNGKHLSEQDLKRINATMYEGGDSFGESIGLRNVYTRLSYFYGEHFSMQVTNNQQAGICVSVYIPILQ